MADQPEKPSILQKVIQAADTAMDLYIAKARSDIASEEDDAVYRKSVYKDITYSSGSQGWNEKSSQLSYNYQSQMARKNTIVAAIIQTIQNKVASHSSVATDQHSKGFRIRLKNEEAAIQKIIEEMFGDTSDSATSKNSEERSEQNKDIASSGADTTMEKAETSQDSESEEVQSPEEVIDSVVSDPEGGIPGDTNEDGELSDKEKRRLAKQELAKQTRSKIEALQEMVLTCGSLDDRPFESRRWNFDSYLRAIVRDRLTYDQIATETVPDKTGKISYWVPVDGGTIRYASPALKKYKDLDMQSAGYEMLYPEKEMEALADQRDALVLDDEKLENEDYKFVQVIRGRIVRAFTPDELSMGMGNPTTDIYTNGYSISELELLINMISAHIFTENYNRSYFTQGFSAKGILHIKAPLARRKLETVRTQWNHMIKGNRNSFQTPIMSGMDDVKWIPLTQNHADMEFNNWMNYLIKVICAVYQIDPVEIGFGMKDEGGSGGQMSGDNTKQKIEVSHNKGFAPLMKFLQTYINNNIVSRIDPEFELEFVGIKEESVNEAIDRQQKEVKFKKSLNEIREEDNLPPIAGADDLILDPTYMTWFQAFHPDGKKMKEQQTQDMAMQGIGDQMGTDSNKQEDAMNEQVGSAEAGLGADQQNQQDQVQQGLSGIQEGLDTTNKDKKPLKKSQSIQKIAVEYYTIKGK